MEWRLRSMSIIRLGDKQTGWLEVSFGLILTLKLRVLIVDDNVVYRRILRRMIQVYCPHLVESIAEAGNPVDGLKLLAAKPFDFVFMDIDMPELTGMETTRIIRGEDPEWMHYPHQPLQCNRNLPIVAVTTNGTPSDQTQYTEAGMSGFLAKPFSHQQITSFLSQPHKFDKICQTLPNDSISLVSVV